MHIFLLFLFGLCFLIVIYLWSKRQIKLTRVLWLSNQNLRMAEFAKLIVQDSEQKIFGADFFENLRDRRNKSQKVYWSVTLFNLALIIILLLCSFHQAAEFIFLGVRLQDIESYKEILLLVSSFLILVVAFISIDISDLNAMLETQLEVRHGVFNLSFLKRQDSSLGLADLPDFKYINYSGMFPPAIYAFVLILVVLVSLLWLLAFVVGYYGMYALMFYKVWHTGSLPWFWTEIIISFCAVTILLGFFLRLAMSAPFPYIDYSFSNKLEALRENNPDAYERRIQQIGLMAARRPALFKSIVTRVKRGAYIKKKRLYAR